MGNNKSTYTAKDMLQQFPGIKNVLMVGIAAAVPCPENIDRHVRLGDIVVSHKQGILQYDMIKRQGDHVEIRSWCAPPSPTLIQMVDQWETERLVGRYPWEAYIEDGRCLDGGGRPPDELDILHDSSDPTRTIAHPNDSSRRPGMPRIFYGVLGSSNTLLKDATLRDQLREKYGIVAVEMEGSGVADSSFLTNSNYLVIRGTCDYADQHKSDTWQGYAAVVAAAYTKALIERLPKGFG